MTKGFNRQDSHEPNETCSTTVWWLGVCERKMGKGKARFVKEQERQHKTEQTRNQTAADPCQTLLARAMNCTSYLNGSKKKLAPPSKGCMAHGAGCSPLELFEHVLVYPGAKVLHRRVLGTEDDRVVIIWVHALGLRVPARKAELVVINNVVAALLLRSLVPALVNGTQGRLTICNWFRGPASGRVPFDESLSCPLPRHPSASGKPAKTAEQRGKSRHEPMSQRSFS